MASPLVICISYAYLGSNMLLSHVRERGMHKMSRVPGQKKCASACYSIYSNNIVEIRWSYDCLVPAIWFAVHVRWHLYIGSRTKMYGLLPVVFGTFWTLFILIIINTWCRLFCLVFLWKSFQPICFFLSATTSCDSKIHLNMGCSLCYCNTVNILQDNHNRYLILSHPA